LYETQHSNFYDPMLSTTCNTLNIQNTPRIK